MDKAFKALSDKTRRKILRDLRERDLSAGEIADRFDISKPSISHHLDALKNAGLVLSEKQGQHVIYSLNTSVFQDVMAWFLEFKE
ncbi:autorepressor SdpR family transcription factor [Phosphitispora fastidiosa]|uniref:autorepressor SdpR family transcription factor n=1 Tax=Phosphitispora fastidiosa TaxID=2837202 RepID=UPI001E5BA093|nr:autorepressor SdpR family transcription factor [Phosphitispora fastidiosa]MBU7006163.1 DNA-binding transcriptional ArsR family regulator [Phosphitispora fastidiosa]